MIHIDYLYIAGTDISKATCKIIEKYVELLMAKDHALIQILSEIMNLTDYAEKKVQIKALLGEDAEARIFEIIVSVKLTTSRKGYDIFAMVSLIRS